MKSLKNIFCVPDKYKAGHKDVKYVINTDNMKHNEMIVIKWTTQYVLPTNFGTNSECHYIYLCSFN